MKRCDTLRDVLAGARGQRGHGGEHRSAVRPSSASMLKRAPLGVRTLRSNGLWSDVVPPTKSIELRRAVAPPCVMPSACALHQHNRTTSHHVRARSHLHARTHARTGCAQLMQPRYIAGTRGTLWAQHGRACANPRDDVSPLEISENCAADCAALLRGVLTDDFRAAALSITDLRDRESLHNHSASQARQVLQLAQHGTAASSSVLRQCRPCLHRLSARTTTPAVR